MSELSNERTTQAAQERDSAIDQQVYQKDHSDPAAKRDWIAGRDDRDRAGDQRERPE